ncbi:MAG: hypothetical protein B6D41_17450 [Chloroflexi bacterium UTCFX4]|nr:MAG: hypothetical protein B6D41_17450 [Chloroflexi bacterium UTCFX4]
MFKPKNQIYDMDAWVEERLSDYLDGTLSPQERAMVEAHLQTSERESASLESLRWTMNLLKQTPAPTLPRQFTLPVPQRAPARSAPRWMLWSLRGVAVGATAAFALLLVGTLLRQPSAGNIAMMPQAAPIAPTVMIALAPTAVPPTQPPAPMSAQNDAATSNTAPTPIMVTVQAPVAASEAIPQTPVAPPNANSPALPQSTQAPSQVRKAASSSPTARATQALPTQAPVQAPPTILAAPTDVAAAGASGAAPELATAPATALDTTSASAAQDTPMPRGLEASNINGTVMALRLRVRSGPGMQFPVVAVLKQSDVVQLVGQSETPGWFAIQFERDENLIEGWVAARFIELDGPIETLPIVTPTRMATPEIVPVTPEETATETPTDAPTEIPELEQTPGTVEPTPEG